MQVLAANGYCGICDEWKRGISPLSEKGRYAKMKGKLVDRVITLCVPCVVDKRKIAVYLVSLLYVVNPTKAGLKCCSIKYLVYDWYFSKRKPDL